MGQYLAVGVLKSQRFRIGEKDFQKKADAILEHMSHEINIARYSTNLENHSLEITLDIEQAWTDGLGEFMAAQIRSAFERSPENGRPDLEFLSTVSSGKEFLEGLEGKKNTVPRFFNLDCSSTMDYVYIPSLKPFDASFMTSSEVLTCFCEGKIIMEEQVIMMRYLGKLLQQQKNIWPIADSAVVSIIG
jgi:hypothetical protein